MPDRAPSATTSRPFGRMLPRMRTRPPGPASQRLARELARYESPGVSTIGTGDLPIVWERARGANVLDADGNVYIDLTAGFGVANLGHANPRVAAAVRKQSRAMLHGLGDVHPNVVKVELARRLAELAPGSGNKVIFCTSGSEAVEVALKTATLATGRHGVLAFTGGFHGLSYGALAVTDREQFRQPFLPQLNPRVARAPYPYCYRCPLGLTYPTCDIACLAPVEQALDSPPAGVGPIGAVVIEPVQGREGEIVPPPDYLPRLKELCARREVLLIVDELITGFGRTGAWFAVDHWGVEPDIMCVGKAMAGGMPIAACIARGDVMDAWAHDEPEAPHSSTFMGHPLGAAAALAVIDEMERRRIPERASSLGGWLLRRCRELQQRHDVVGDVRGLGMMVGIELVTDRQTRAPASAEASAAIRAALERGVILLAGGSRGNVLSLTPPLTITRPQLEHALRVVDECLALGAAPGTAIDSP